MCLRIASKSGLRSLPGTSCDSEHMPCLAEQKSIGESSCSSFALRSIRSSRTSSMTASMRRSGLSILFMRMMTLCPSSRALDKTKRV